MSKLEYDSAKERGGHQQLNQTTYTFMEPLDGVFDVLVYLVLENCAPTAGINVLSKIIC